MERPTSPRPEGFTTDRFNLFLTSKDTEENVAALNMIKDDPSIYTTVGSAHLKNIFTRCLFVADKAMLSVSARYAFIALAGHVSKIRDTETISILFAPIARTLISNELCLPSDNEGSCLRALEELAIVLPEVIRPHVNSLITLCHQLIHSGQKDEFVRCRAITLLSTICRQAPDAIPEDRLPDIAASCLLMMANVDHDASMWLVASAVTREEADWGKDAFRIILNVLCKKDIVPFTLQRTDKLLQTGDWRWRHSALHALEIINNTGRTETIDPILSCAKAALKDPHPRVRHQACTVFHKIALSDGPNLEMECLQEAVPALIAMMADASSPRVACCAAQALGSLIDGGVVEYVSNQADLTNAIAANFNKLAKMSVISRWNEQLTHSQLDILTSLATIAYANDSDHIVLTPEDITRALFVDSVYNRFIDAIKGILQATDDSFKRLRITALSCLGKMFIANNSMKSTIDCGDVLKSCVAILRTDVDYGFLSAVRGYCNVIRSLGEVYLPMMMSLLMPMAICPAFVPGTSRNDYFAATIRSRLALQLIEDFAKIFGDVLAPYVYKVSDILTKNMSTSDHVSTVLPHLMNCVKDQRKRASDGGLPMHDLWKGLWSVLKNRVFKDARKRGVYAEWLAVIHDCIGMLGRKNVTSTDVLEIGCMLKDVLASCPFFGQPSNNNEEEDKLLLSMVAKVIWALLKTVRANSFKTVNSLMPSVYVKMDASYDGIHTIFWFIESAPSLAYASQRMIGHILLKSLGENRADWRWEGAYVVGRTLAERFQWAPVAVRFLPALATMIDRPDARESHETICGTETAIWAAAKIIKRCYGVDENKYLPLLLDWLLVHGIRVSATDAVLVYGYLAELIEEQHPLIIGENDHPNWPKLVRILVLAQERVIFDETDDWLRLKARLAVIVQRMKLFDEPLSNQSVAEARRDRA